MHHDHFLQTIQAFFVNKSVNNWKNITGVTEKNNKLLKHSRSQSHRSAVTFETEGSKMTSTGRTVYSMVHVQSQEEWVANLNRISDFIDAAYFLFKNKIAHTTNYSTLLDLISCPDGSHKVQIFTNASPLNAS